MTDHEQLQQIVYKILNGSASFKEMSLLKQYLETVDESTALSVLFPYDGEQANATINLSADERHIMFDGILRQAGQPHKVMHGRMARLFTGERKYRWMAAASVAAIITLFALGYMFLNRNEQAGKLATHYQEQVSRPGQTKVVMLPDGSHVYLNADSRLKYPDRFSDSTRVVYLEGEAFFEVAHDSLHPFIVQAGRIATRVLGTSFNVRAYGDELDMVVGVKTGKVKVSIIDPEQTVSHTRGIAETILIKARQAVYHAGNEEGIRTGEVNPEDVGAWSGNKLIYNNKTLDYILHELERVYNVRFKMQGEQALANRYTVRLDKMELNNTLNDLSLLANIGFTQQDSVIKVTVR